MKATERMTGSVIRQLREAVLQAFGNEILAVGVCDESGTVIDIHVAARGDDSQVPALAHQMERGDVVIHNHPGGKLSPSGPDLQVASRLGNSGIGFFIINNNVDTVYVVAEPVAETVQKPLDPLQLRPLLDSGGAIARRIDDFIPRQEQLDMMSEAAEAFNNDEIAVIEAGTGVGKSFAYLLPAVFWADQNSERVIISTNTINLQQQILEKDLPVINDALRKKLKIVLAKGRSNYLCLRRLEEARREISLLSDIEDDLEKLREWTEKTRDGSRSDLSFQPQPQVWRMVCSEADTCLGLKCHYRDECFVLKARKEAASADIIVANHHLLFADLSVKLEEGGFDSTAVLPPCKRYVFDEAHTMEASATTFISRRLNKYMLLKQGQRLIRRHGKQQAGILQKLREKWGDNSLLDEAGESVRECFARYDSLESAALTFLEDQSTFTVTEKEKESPAVPFFGPMKAFHKAVLSLLDSMVQIVKELPPDLEEEPEVYEFEIVLRRFELMAEFCFLFLEERDTENNVYWLEKGYSHAGGDFCNYIITPLDLSPLLYEAVFRPNKTVICTSATLTVGKRFTSWMNQVGLGNGNNERIRTLLLDSPFPYSTNVLLGIPNDAPAPQDVDFTEYVSRLVSKILAISEGRALVLFTSYSMMNEVYAAVKPQLVAASISSMKQGEQDRARLLRFFIDNVASVLFATDSFWQGIDAPGQTCSVVILAKLPFRVPTEPVTKARLDRIKRLGGNPFFERSLPEAVMKLKQGFGRLMRKQDDRGVIVISDPRIVRKSYGKLFLSSLPETRKSIKETTGLFSDIENFLYEN